MTTVTRLPTAPADTARRYKGTIQGTALEQTLEEQRLVALEIEAVLRMAGIALDPDTQQIDMPDYGRALRGVADRICALAICLEASSVEDRADEIAQEREAREARAQGGAA